MRLILIRHGQTDWNVRHIVQGKNDLPLNRTGVAQAEDIGNFLKEREISAIYSSPLRRAYQTAIRIARGGAVTVDDRLTERDFGKWDGMGFPQIAEAYPDLWKIWRTTPAEAEIPGAERIATVAERCLSILGEIVQRHCPKNETVVIVSHTITLKLIMGHFMKLPLNSLHSIGMSNCGYNEIMVESLENGVVTVANDVTFLHTEVAL